MTSGAAFTLIGMIVAVSAAMLFSGWATATTEKH